jgi:hypothetical protein
LRTAGAAPAGFMRRLPPRGRRKVVAAVVSDSGRGAGRGGAGQKLAGARQ